MSGNGYFGRWTEGLHGVPAYLYETDQTRDKKALTMTYPAWNDRRNHTFVIGNDRLVATCSNFGYVQVREDGRCPKFLNDYHPASGAYGGGFGYLKSDTELISTFYDGQNMRREYGAGYFRKLTEGEAAEIEEILFAPYGDEPALLKKVRIVNRTLEPLSATWYDYFGAAAYQFTFTHYCAGQLTLRTANVSKFRRRLDKDFVKTETVDTHGSLIARSYRPGISLARAGQAAGQAIFAAMAKRFYKVKNNRGFDDRPPAVLYTCLNREAEVLSDAKGFFGGGGAVKPDYFYCPSELKPKAEMHLLCSHLRLAPGEAAELYYLYAFSCEGYDIAALREKYASVDFDKELAATLEKWKTERVSVRIPGKEWVDRELLWHNAYLRGSMTYSEYFVAHILSQGGHYQYLIGLQGAPRDQLQHALPFIYTEPYIAREHILFTLREMSGKGELPYATHGCGMMVAGVMVPSDLQLMLLDFAAEYVLAARDFSFLQYAYTSNIDGNKTKRTVFEGLMLAYRYVRDEVGRGVHGLVRMKTGDWNDQAVYGRVPFLKTRYAQKHGESMLNSGIAVYALGAFAEMLKAAGYPMESAEAAALSKDIKEAFASQWNGNWYKRAFLGEKLGWLGDELLWLEPQPWALISGCAEGEKKDILVNNIRRLLDNPNGASLISHNPDVREDSKGLSAGTLENGGIWPAVNGYLVWGLAKVSGAYAYEEWLKNSRYAQANAYPEIWYGIWSGPDSVNASYAKYPGRTQNSKNPYTGKREKFFKMTVGVDWEDFPVLNLHAHTWQQYTVFKLLGAEFFADRVVLAPVLPEEEYEVTSRLLSVKKENNAFTIRYCPLEGGAVKLVFIDKGKILAVSCDGEPCAFRKEDGAVFVENYKCGSTLKIEYEI